MTTPYASGPPTWPPFAVQQQPTPQPQRRRSSRWLLWVVLGLVVLGLAGIGGALYLVNADEPDRERGPSRSALISACRDAVRAKLKAPASAKFPGGERVENVGTTYRVFGQVDAQNSFGALLRGNFRCVATLEGQAWSVYSVDFPGS